jgi:rhodanese-related sulfurtransferase
MSKRYQARRNNSQQVIIFGGIILVAIIVVGIWLAGQSTAQTTLAPMISVEEAAQKRDQGAFILDVRTVEEWEEVHIPNSTLIPLDELPLRLSEVPSNREIVVVCRSGNRSQVGRDILLDAGFKQVTSMSGGVNEWESLGYPIVSGP